MAVMAKAATRCILLLAVAALSACTGQSLSPKQALPEGFAGWEDAVPAYRLGPGDRFQVKFTLVPDMDEEVMIGPDGSAGLRMAGQVDAAGLTPAELAGLIETKAKRWMRAPQVSVGLRETPSNRAYVGGAVARPGPYLLNGRIGVMEAIMLAGGFDREARYEEVVLIRRNPQNKPMLRTIDLRNFIETGTAVGDVPMAAGDILFVPRSSIAETGLWVEQFINRVVPFERVFSYTIGRTHGVSTSFP
ncbi:polysaccharide biosynthesis/export family protein [Azospirillum canadense]|uniref:polysaccharide biosynthesis/export family protein n=1 Tax=Azospirillum canadense TaxID=403962 RepID=UPI002225D77E|nr:polysaccharide biosynthesis/export family protein [Azospirillum canadense]MCW2238771.1 protein involved in polysaccharide export with SLBB domain [Azospirillum canadense]